MWPDPDTLVRQFRAALIFFLGLLAACTSGPSQVTADLVGESPARQRLTGLPFHPQIEDQCGPATLATMLAARGVEVEPQDLRGKIYIPGKKGSLTTEMIARGRRYGMLVYSLQPELAAILKEVAAGNPVLVLQNLGFDWAPRWHFSVVIGYDLDRGVAVLRSGNDPEREVVFELFLKTWSRADHWAVVVMLPSQLPATARQSHFVAAASELEQIGEYLAALAAYESAIKHWPDSDTARFGAGNTAYALSQYERAKAHYMAYLILRPDSAAGWNNLAYSLMQLHCPRESRQAIACAQRLEPDNSTFKDSERELSAAPAGESEVSCLTPQC